MDRERALLVLNNWRASHAFPLNTFQNGLRRRAAGIYEHALVSQRLKRTPSVLSKLNRFHSMKLSQMQDIGGCRAVVRNRRELLRIENAYLSSSIRHELIRRRDYIDVPKGDGYRCLHLMYKYVSDRSTEYNGLLIEIQLRTQLQHAWATAVETADILNRTNIKSGQGPKKWRRFFAVISSVFAEIEGTPHVRYTPRHSKRLRSRARSLAKELRVFERLTSLAQALEVMTEPRHSSNDYYLLILNTQTFELQGFGYSASEQADMNAHYIEAERDSAPEEDIVVVATRTVKDLKRAYPNYFLDATRFIDRASRALYG
ncbi:MAG: RelA/SpoT domain-containing protein [Phycisphaerales bacterium]